MVTKQARTKNNATVGNVVEAVQKWRTVLKAGSRGLHSLDLDRGPVYTHTCEGFRLIYMPAFPATWAPKL